MSLENRIREALGSEAFGDSWNSVLRLYADDREAFYQLACDGLGAGATGALRELESLAQDVRRVIRASYTFNRTSDGGATVRAHSGKMLEVPAPLADRVERFLRDVDGKSIGDRAGKDYVGEDASEAEARFKLGEPLSGDERRELEAIRKSKPMVLRVASEDLDSLRRQPAYVTRSLMHTARKTVLAPLRVYRDLKRGIGTETRLAKGWVFCGKPRRAYGNEGWEDAPSDMLYVVYADNDGYVFDWDWVKEDPDDPDCPLRAADRFGNPVGDRCDAVLDIPATLEPGTFDPTFAHFSKKGDCIFCYLTDQPSFADRENEDLTVFRRLGSETVTGFKVKNVLRILRQDKNLTLDSAPDLIVSVDKILLTMLRGNQAADVAIYQVIIRALLGRSSTPPSVRVPRGELLLAGA